MKINDYLTVGEVNFLKKFCELQYYLFTEFGVSDFDCIEFDYDGMSIINPFLDENGVCEVDPVKYYGEKFLNSEFIKIFDNN